MPTDAYLGNGNEGHDSDDYTPKYVDSYDGYSNPDNSDEDWHVTTSGRKCEWCKDGLTSPYEPSDSIDAEKRLCRGHVAEYEGLSLDGLDRMESEEMYDML